ncbi:MAG TPA: DUF4433 domain-containing protein [Polyangia bacterium]|jgi:hypothetical protein
MTPPTNPHITHVDNLPSIISEGGLWSDAERLRRRVGVTAIGYQHIKARRLRRAVPVAARGVVGEYVPFNFCPRSVMLYVIHQGHAGYAGGQRPIVHLVSSVQAVVALGLKWAFTDRHAELGFTAFFDDLAKLDAVSWELMPLTYWADPDVKERRQAEFLVHQHCPWTAVTHIGVIDHNMQLRVETLLNSVSHRPQVLVRPDWYY